MTQLQTDILFVVLQSQLNIKKTALDALNSITPLSTEMKMDILIHGEIIMGEMKGIMEQIKAIEDVKTK
jgi:hypothetical protein